MSLPQSYLLIEIVPIIFLHVKIVIVMYGYSGTPRATPLHSTIPPGMLTVYPLPYPTLHVTHTRLASKPMGLCAYLRHARKPSARARAYIFIKHL